MPEAFYFEICVRKNRYEWSCDHKHNTVCYFYISLYIYNCISLLLVLIFPLYEIVNLYKCSGNTVHVSLCRVVSARVELM